jgi:phosphoribosyl 1,2-cyclic phosphodiesterase
MLLDGPYPPHLKRRVGGDWGHLNNQQAVELLRQIDCTALRHLVVAHISEKNNSRERARSALLSVLDSLDGVIFAEQADGFDWLDLVPANA